MAAPLPPSPSLENLKKQAKALQKAWRSGDPDAVARLRAIHPRYTGTSGQQASDARPRLTDCQLMLAREAGFDTWPQLRAAVESADKEPADQFVDLACLCYDDPHFDHRSFYARAHEMLRQNPWLAEAGIWSAAAAGNASAVARFLDRNRELVSRPGPNGWVPLICACYSRVTPLDPSHSTFDVAKLLLDRGANPNACTMKGNADERLDQTPRRFTALTGTFGGGSTGLANQPPHPRWRELAELLLERGADPADERALMHNQTACLDMLLRHGLKPDAQTQDVTLMGRALSLAVRRGHTDQVRLLLSSNARADEIFDGKTPWQHAMLSGHPEIAEMLEQANAPTSPLDDVERFVSLCIAGNEPGVRAMLAHAPELLERAPKDLVFRACGTRRREPVKLALDLGFDPNWLDEVTALQSMAGEGEEELVRLLLDRGASLESRDPFYDGTAIEWAEFFDQTHTRDMLLGEKGICLFDALGYDRLDRVPEILARDPAALNRPFAECISRDRRPEDWKSPLIRMIEKGKTDAVRVLLAHGADVRGRHPDGRTPLQLATDLGLAEIASLLPATPDGSSDDRDSAQRV
ncbi:MAG TPA: ankyrin repeat domain-containing protein [Vicinamibacterales bacterium]|nr:ankyrin repeat domain-containing protein [Vicinamibacterales bacterium]